jgi:hypothetical protein
MALHRHLHVPLQCRGWHGLRLKLAHAGLLCALGAFFLVAGKNPGGALCASVALVGDPLEPQARGAWIRGTAKPSPPFAAAAHVTEPNSSARSGPT